MIFTSFSFLLFLSCVVAAYFVYPSNKRWMVLLAGSIVFYGIAGIQFLPFILGTAAVSFFAARKVYTVNALAAEQLAVITDKEEKKSFKEQTKKKCRNIVTAAILVILGYLAVTKFGNTILEWTSMDSGLSIIVPLGISYYSFSTVGYILDVYWKRYEPEQNFFHFLLYVMYFPHILQGPIARYDRLGVQFFEEHPFDYKRFCFGLQLMIWGFFQKLVIADRLGIFVSAVYDDYAKQKGITLLAATVFYAIQIYADFSGCVNIAKGVSEIFGIEIESNFRQPYFSRSVDEFWRRWHMTLGAWFKDYLCIPISMTKAVKNLSKSARKKYGSKAGVYVVTIFPLIAVWTATGIWHGTGLNYILWAVWQGGIIILSLLLEDWYKKAKQAFRINEEGVEWKTFQMLRTFVLTGIIPRVIVRASSVGAAATIFKKIFTDLHWYSLLDGSFYEYGLNLMNMRIAIGSVLVLAFVSVLKEKGVSIRESVAQMHIVARWMIYIAAVFSVVIFGIYGPGYDASTFAYMGF